MNRTILATVLGTGLLLMLSGSVYGNPWSDPITLVDTHGRLAIGNQLHVVGHTSGQLVHRTSVDDGATWSAPTVISAQGSSNVPMQYGGLYAQGDAIYLLTAAADMGPSSRHLDFRRSLDNGATWSNPIRITSSGQELRRANIVASGNSVHVFGGQTANTGTAVATGLYYFRSTDNGSNWDAGTKLHDDGGGSVRMAVDGETIHIAFGQKVEGENFNGESYYMRSADNGQNWSAPTFIGEPGGLGARHQIVAADGQLLAMWQREGDTLPADRLGYNRSEDGGLTWIGPSILPEGTGVDRNHHQMWLTPGGGLHVAWTHGPSNLNTSATGYMFSPDYGETWFETEIALSTSGAANLPHNIVADENWVHILAQPPGAGTWGAGTYVRRQVIPEPGALGLIGAAAVLLSARPRRRRS